MLGIADQDIADAQGQFQNLGSQAFLTSVQKFRGLGPLSNAEGAKAESAYTRATSSTIGQTEARKAWSEVKASVQRLKLAAQYEAMTGLPQDAPPPIGTVPAIPKPAQPAAPATNVEARISNDAEYDALPSGTPFVGPDGVPRVKP